MDTLLLGLAVRPYGLQLRTTSPSQPLGLLLGRVSDSERPITEQAGAL